MSPYAVTRLFLEQHDAAAGLDGADLSVFVHGNHQQAVHDPLLPLAWVHQQVGPGGGRMGEREGWRRIYDGCGHFAVWKVIIYNPSCSLVW